MMMMKRTAFLGLLLLLGMIQAPSMAQTATKTAIARMWHGQVAVAKAEEYTKYLNENGISKIKTIPGNLGVQMFRKVSGETADFVVISYWESVDAIKKFAGEDYEKAYSMPRDPEFLINPEKNVRHFEVVINDWK